MGKLIYLAVFAVLAALDWRTVRRWVSPAVYFIIFAAAAILVCLSVWLVKDLSLARLFL